MIPVWGTREKEVEVGIQWPVSGFQNSCHAIAVHAEFSGSFPFIGGDQAPYSQG